MHALVAKQKGLIRNEIAMWRFKITSSDAAIRSNYVCTLLAGTAYLDVAT